MSGELNEKNGIGLWGGIFTITGFIIGVPVFILPGQLVELVGPAVIISYVIAGIVAMLSCIVAAQIGVIMPSTGGSFVAISRLISPFFGFMTIWILLISAVVANAFLAFGFAEYFQEFMSGIDRSVIAVSVILLFGAVNAFASNAVVRVQGVLIILFLTALGVYFFASLPHFDSTLMDPFVPNGYGAVLVAATSAYFSFGGFVLLLELGGEVRQPHKTIPKGLFISFLIALTTYILVSLSIAGTAVPIERGGMVILSIARQILPPWFMHAFVLAILAAAATSINSLVLAYSSDHMLAGKSGFLPKKMGRVSASSGAPVSAVVFLTALSCGAVFFGSYISQFVIVAFIGLMLQQIFLAVCLWRIPEMMPEQYQRSEFRIPAFLVRPVAILLIVASCAFIILPLLETPNAVLMLRD